MISCAVAGYDDKKEHRRHYHAGRMEMLFGLVDAGKLTLDEAAGFAGLAWGEAADMLQGWQEARRM